MSYYIPSLWIREDDRESIKRVIRECNVVCLGRGNTFVKATSLVAGWYCASIDINTESRLGMTINFIKGREPAMLKGDNGWLYYFCRPTEPSGFLNSRAREFYEEVMGIAKKEEHTTIFEF